MPLDFPLTGVLYRTGGKIQQSCYSWVYFCQDFQFRSKESWICYGCKKSDLRAELDKTVVLRPSLKPIVLNTKRGSAVRYK